MRTTYRHMPVAPAVMLLAIAGLIAVAAPPPTPGIPALDVDFSPGPPGALRGRVAREIRGARERIDVALYTGMTVETAIELARAAREGRRVRVLVDAEALFAAPDASARAPESDPPRWRVILDEAGVPVRTLPLEGGASTARPAFHHKFAVLDGGTVLTGSWNWSARGDGTNYENLVVIRDVPFARRFGEEFERLWGEAEAGPAAPAASGDAKARRGKSQVGTSLRPGTP